MSYNIYPLWYHDTPAKEYLSDLYPVGSRKTDGRGKPFIVSEIGCRQFMVTGILKTQSGLKIIKLTLKEQIKACMEQLALDVAHFYGNFAIFALVMNGLVVDQER